MIFKGHSSHVPCIFADFGAVLCIHGDQKEALQVMLP